MLDKSLDLELTRLLGFRLLNRNRSAPGITANHRIGARVGDNGKTDIGNEPEIRAAATEAGKNSNLL